MTEIAEAARHDRPVGDPAGTSYATLLSGRAAISGDGTALTFLDYTTSIDGRALTLTWRELDERVEAVAVALARLAAPGERAAVLAPQSTHWVVAFLGAIRAGLVAVPLFGPSLPGHAGRLAAALNDSAPAVVLTVDAEHDDVRGFLTARDIPAATLAVDGLDPVPAGTHTWPEPQPDGVAFLQYTSGSTRRPTGVVLSHRNVVTNARQAFVAIGGGNGSLSAVSWLPLYHDMGLMLGVGAMVALGIPSLLMDPLAFLAEPVRWLRALSASPGAVTAAPSFAYSYTASRVTEHEASYLELSRVVSLVDGSEPIDPRSVARFHDAFAPYGLRPEAHCPAYGLAEATVFVSGSTPDRRPTLLTLDRDRLAAGRAEPVGDGGTPVTLVGCGRPAQQEVGIVDPANGDLLGDGLVGEIRVRGDNVGSGYWRRPDESAETFDRISEGTAGWLATGDLGMLVEGELYVTGRMKDLIIVDGRNHYPQDVELTVEGVDGVRLHSAGAFAVPGPDGETAALVVELAKDGDIEGGEVTALATALRAMVAREHGLTIRDVVVLPPGEVPRTSSGKISRARCRARYLDGTFAARRLA